MLKRGAAFNTINQYRWYDSRTGRWFSEDPIGFQGGSTNLYLYVHGNPLKYKDPNGEIGFLAAIGVGAVLGGAASGVGAYLAGSRDFNSIASSVVGGAIGGAGAVIFGAGAAFSAAGGSIALGAALPSTSAMGVIASEVFGLGLGQLLNWLDLGIGKPDPAKPNPVKTPNNNYNNQCPAKN